MKYIYVFQNHEPEYDHYSNNVKKFNSANTKLQHKIESSIIAPKILIKSIDQVI
jgi:hypothetical protein